MADEHQTSGSPTGGELPKSAHNPPAYERTDAHLGGIAWAGVGLTVITVAVLAVCVAIFHYYVVRTGGNEGVIPPLPVADRGKLPQPPVLEGLEPRNTQFFSPKLDTPPDEYDWVDKQHQIVRMPINVAMRLAVKRLVGAKSSSDQENSQLAAERTEPPSAASSGRVLIPARQ